MQIELPSKEQQLDFVAQAAFDEAVQQLKSNLSAPTYKTNMTIDESQYDDAHLRTENANWQPPAPPSGHRLF